LQLACLIAPAYYHRTSVLPIPGNCLFAIAGHRESGPAGVTYAGARHCGQTTQLPIPSVIAMPARSARDWVLLLALSAMWGTAFLFIKLGVATVPPATLAAGRIALGALILYIAVRWRGLALPPPGRAWARFGVIALIGNAAPFFLISWGQQTIDSALAGILMAVMPLTTLLLAHFFVAGERMTAWRAIGFCVGFSGIVVLMGPAALAGLHENVAAQLAVLAGAVCYAANSVIARRLIVSNFLVASAAVMLVAAVMAVPLALLLDRPWTLTPSAGSLAAIVWLGIGPTALATILYFKLIATAGPTFMSLVNYLSPVAALSAGVALLGEQPGSAAFAGLCLILLGIAVSRRG
jgi:drug/metabolite transporter (DMT)-like permease